MESGSTSDDSHTVSLLFHTTAGVPTVPIGDVSVPAIPVPIVPVDGFIGILSVMRLTVNDAGGGGGNEPSGDTDVVVCVFDGEGVASIVLTEGVPFAPVTVGDMVVRKGSAGWLDAGISAVGLVTELAAAPATSSGKIL